MPDRRETMAGFHANQKKEYNNYFTIPDYREGGSDDPVKIPAKMVVCPTCRGKGSMVNPSIDSHGITQSEMDELGDDFRKDYFAGHFDVPCSECGGRNVVLEADRHNLTDEQEAALFAWEKAVADEGQEIYYRSMGIEF